jgi:hypothetical protein
LHEGEARSRRPLRTSQVDHDALNFAGHGVTWRRCHPLTNVQEWLGFGVYTVGPLSILLMALGAAGARNWARNVIDREREQELTGLGSEFREAEDRLGQATATAWWTASAAMAAESTKKFSTGKRCRALLACMALSPMGFATSLPDAFQKELERPDRRDAVLSAVQKWPGLAQSLGIEQNHVDRFAEGGRRWCSAHGHGQEVSGGGGGSLRGGVRVNRSGPPCRDRARRQWLLVFRRPA